MSRYVIKREILRVNGMLHVMLAEFLMVYIVLELLFMLGSGSWILQRILNPEGTL